MDTTIIKRNSAKLLIHIVLIFMSACTLIPFMLALIISFSDEHSIMKNGYSFIPDKFSLYAYKYVITGGMVLNSYRNTIIITLVGTLISIIVTAMCGYVLSVNAVKYRKIIGIIVIIPMIANPGLVPWYIVCTRYLHLKNTLFAVILPLMTYPFNVFLLRNYFKSIPGSITESAQIDGAGPFYTFVKIIIPVSKPILATVALFISLGYWNDFVMSLWFIDNPKLFPLQYLLYKITSALQTMHDASSSFGGGQLLPTESVQMATFIITVGPVIFFFPFAQKYFAKGIMLGAIKG